MGYLANLQFHVIWIEEPDQHRSPSSKSLCVSQTVTWAHVPGDLGRSSISPDSASSSFSWTLSASCDKPRPRSSNSVRHGKAAPPSKPSTLAISFRCSSPDLDVPVHACPRRSSQGSTLSPQGKPFSPLEEQGPVHNHLRSPVPACLSISFTGH